MENLNKANVVIAYLDAMEVDGETMEYILGEVNMREQMLRQLIMSSPLEEVQNLLEEKLAIRE